MQRQPAHRASLVCMSEGGLRAELGGWQITGEESVHSSPDLTVNS